jgi:NADPH:quinone reductase-like Zn-dependent oxidoreductase
MDTMMALRAHSRGGPERLVYERAPRPDPGPDEALVEVHAAGITFTELGWDETWLTAEGRDRTPIIPSHEVSGRVAALGPDAAGSGAPSAGAPDVTVGDEVFGLVRFDRNGAAAEYVVLPAGELALRPTAVDHVASASVPLAALTAWQAIYDHAASAPGEEIVVRGAAGGVGVFAVQLAAQLGAHVTAVASGTDAPLLTALGAERVVDYATAGASQAVGVADVLLDFVGGPTPDDWYAVVRPGGRLVTLSAPPSASLADDRGITATFFIVRPQREQLARLAELIDGGRLRPIVAQTFPLSEGRQAYESGSKGTGAGKTVLTVR